MTRALRTVVATAAVALTLPAGAQAASGTSVAKTVDRAGTLTERAVVLAQRGADARTAKTVKQARRTVTIASRDARRLAAKARTTSRRLDAAGVLALVAARLAEDVSSYAGALPRTDGGAQNALAGALPGSIAAHDSIVDALEALAAQLPAEHRAAVEQVIAALVAEWPKQVDALADAATAEDLPTAISGIVETALGSATRLLNEAIGALKSVVATLPEPAQQAIGQALAIVEPILTEVMGVVTGISKTITSQIGGIMDMVSGLVGKLVPGLFGTIGSPDDSPSGDDAGGDDSGSGLGGLFDGIPVVGGLLDSLLGGLPIIGDLFGGRS